MAGYDTSKTVWASLGDAFAPRPTGNAEQHPLGYAQDITQQEARDLIRDPRFIQDVIDFYRERDGTQFSTVEEAVEKFFSDRAWRNLNTGGIVKDLYQANTMPDEQGRRLGRLQAVYEAYPNFYEEGGRGLKGLMQNTGVMVADVANLVGFGSGAVAARGAAATTRYAMREAAKEGVEYTGRSPLRAGIQAGATRGALLEAPLSGAISGAADYGIQLRNMELGLQDEISGTQIAKTAGVGTGIGALAGGAFGAAGAVTRNPLRAGSRSPINEGIQRGDDAFARHMALEAERQAASPAVGGPARPADDGRLDSALNDFEAALKRELDDAIDTGMPPGATNEDIAALMQTAAAGRGTGIPGADRLAATLGIFRSMRNAPARVAAMRAEAAALAATDPNRASAVLAQADSLESSYNRMTRHVLDGASEGAKREAESGGEILRMLDGPPQQPIAGALPAPDPSAPVRGPDGEGGFVMQRGVDQDADPATQGQAGATPDDAATEAATAASAADADAAPSAAEGAVAGGEAAQVTPQERLAQLDKDYNSIKPKLDNLTRKEKAGALSEAEAAELADLRSQREQINAQKKEARRQARAQEQAAANQAAETAAPSDGRPRANVPEEPTNTAAREAEDILSGGDEFSAADREIMRTAEDLAAEFAQSEKEAVDFLTRVLGYDNSVRKELREATKGMSRAAARTERMAFVSRKIHEVRAGLQLSKIFNMLGGTGDYRVYIPEAVRALIRVQYPKDAELMSGLYDKWFVQQAPSIVEAMYRRLGDNASLEDVMREVDVIMGRDVVGIVDSFFNGSPSVQRIEFNDVKLPNTTQLPEEAAKALENVRKSMIEEGKKRGWKPEFIQLALNTYIRGLLEKTKVVEFKGKKRLVDSQNMNPLVPGAHIGRKQDNIAYGRHGEIVPRNAVGGLQSIIKPAKYGPEDRPFFQRLFQAARGRDEQGNPLRYSSEESASRAIEDAFVDAGTQRRRRDPILAEQNAERVKAIDEARKGLKDLSDEEARALYDELVSDKVIPGIGIAARDADNPLTAKQLAEILSEERARLTSDVDVAVRGREVEAGRTQPRRIAEKLYARYVEMVRRRDSMPEGGAERAAISAQIKKVRDKISSTDPSFFEERKLKRAQRKALAEAKLAARNTDTPPTDAQIAEAVGNEIGLPTTKEDIEVATNVADEVSRKVALDFRRARENEEAITAFREHQDAALLQKQLEDIQAKYKTMEGAAPPATKPVGRNEPLVVVHKGVEVDVKNSFRMREAPDGSFEIRFLGDPVGTLRKLPGGGYKIDPLDGNLATFEANSLRHALRLLPEVFEDRVMIARRQGDLFAADAPENLSYVEKDWRETNTYKGAKEEPLDAPGADDIEAGKATPLDARVAGFDVPPNRDVAIQILSGPLEGSVRVIPASREGFASVTVRSVLGRQANQQFTIGHVESGVSGIRAQETFRPLKDGDTYIPFRPGSGAKGRAKTHVYSSDADVINPESQPIPYDQLASRTIDPEDLPPVLRETATIKTFQDLHDHIVNMENVPWNHPGLKNPEQYQKFVFTLNALYEAQAKLAPHGIKYPNASRRGSMNQLSAILGSVNKQEVSAIFNVLRGLSSAGGVMPRFSGSPEGYFYRQPHSGLQGGTPLNSINIDTSAKTLQQPVFAKTIHEIGHWAYFNILSPAQRADFWSAMGKYINENGADMAALKARLPGSASNELHSPAEFFANQFAQWAISSGRTGDQVGLANLWRKVVHAITSVMERFFLGGQRADLIDPDLIPLFERIMPDIESSGTKYQAIAKKFAPTGGRIGIIAKKLDDYEVLKGKIENAVRSGSPDEILSVLAGDGSGSANYVSEVYSVSGKRGTKFLRKKSDGTGGGRRIGLFDGGETVGQRVNKRGEMTDAVSDPNGYFIRGKMLRLMFDIQRATAEMRKRQVAMDSDAAQRELDALIATQGDGDVLGVPDMPAGARGLEELALQNFSGDVGDLELLANAAIEVLNEAQTGLRQQFRRAFPKTDVGEGLAILPDGTLLGTQDSAASNVFRKRAQARKNKLAKDSDAAVADLLRKADEAFEEGLGGNPPTGEIVHGSSPRDMSMNELASAMRAVGKRDPRFSAYAAEMMRKISASPEITRAASEPLPDTFAQFADRDNKSLVNGLVSALEKADADRVTMIATELRARQLRLGDKSDPFLLPKDSKVGRALQVEAAQTAGVHQGNGIPPNAPAAIKEALSKFTHRDKRIEHTLRTMAYRMMNLMGRAERNLLDNVSFMTVDDVYRLAGLAAPDDARAAFSDMSRLEGEAFNQVRKNLRRYAIGLHSKTAKATPLDLMHEIGHMVVRSSFAREQLDTIVSQFNEALVKGDRIAQTVAAKYGTRDPQRAAEEWFVEGWANYLGERVAKGDIWKLRNGEQPLRFKTQLESLVDRLIEFVAYVTNGLIGNNSVRQQYRRLTFYGDMFAANRASHPFKSAVNATGNQSVVASLAPHYAREVVDSLPEKKLALAREFTQAGPYDDLMDFVYYHGTPNGSSMERGALSPVLQPSGPEALSGPGIYVIRSQAMGRYYSEAGHMASIRKMIDEATDSPARRQEGYEIAEMLVEKRNSIDELTREMTLSGYSEMTKARAAKFVDADGVDDLMPDDSALSLIRTQRRLESMLQDEQRLWKTLNEVTGANYNPKVLPLLVRSVEPFDFRDSAFYSFTSPRGNVSWIVSWLSKNGYVSQRGAEKLMSRADTEFSGSDFYEMLVEEAMLDGGLAMNPTDAKVRLQQAMRELGYDSFQVTEPGHTGLESHDALVLFDSNQVKHVDADAFDADLAGIYNSNIGNEFMGISHRIADEMATENRVLNVNDFLGIGNELQRLGMPDAMQSVVRKIVRKEQLSPEDIDTTRRYGIGNVLRENSSTLRHMGAHWMADRIKGEGGPSIYDRHNSDLAERLNPLLEALRSLPDVSNAVGRWAKRSIFAGSVVGGAKAGSVIGSAIAPGVGTIVGTAAGLAAGAFVGSRIKVPQPKSHERILRAMREGREAMSRLKPEERAVAEKIQAAFREELAQMKEMGIPVGDATLHRNTDTYVNQIWDAEAIRESPSKFLNGVQAHFMRESRIAGEPMTAREAAELSRSIFDKILDTDGHLAAETVMHQKFSSPFYQRFINLTPGDVAELDGFLVNDLEGLLSRYYNKTVRKRTLAKDFGVGGHAFNAYRAVAELGRPAAVKTLMTNKNIFVNRREFFNSAEVENLIVPSLNKSREEVEALVDQVVATLGDNRASQIANKQKAKDILLAEIDMNNVDDAMLSNYRLRVDAIVNGLADFSRPTNSKALTFMDQMANVLNQRPLDGSDGTGLIYSASRKLRAFNSVSLLGFATLTSIPDAVLPLIRSGDFRSWVKGMQQWYRIDPAYRNAARDIGVGIENLIHDRMTHMSGEGSQRFANSFFHFTGLTPWTSTWREVSALVGFNAMKAEAEIARKYAQSGRTNSTRYKTAIRFLERYGLSGEGMIEGGVDFASPFAPRLDDIQTYAKNPQLRYAVMRFANESVFMPDPNDVPLWGQTPWGRMIFQLKSFPVMMGRMAKYALDEGASGNPYPIAYMATVGAAFGMGAMAVKDIAQSRGGEDGRERALRQRTVDKTAIGEGLAALGLIKGKDYRDEQELLAWYFDGLMALGGLGFLGELFFDSAAHIDNGNFGFQRLLGTVIGPSYDAAYTAFQAAGAAQEATLGGGENTSKMRSGLRSAASRVPVLGGDRDFRETVADVGGPPRNSGGVKSGSFSQTGFKSPGWGNSGSF